MLSVSAANLQIINDNTPNLNNAGFYACVPASLSQTPPLILAIHYCTGISAAYYTNTACAPLADQHGYLVIYSNCKPELAIGFLGPRFFLVQRTQDFRSDYSAPRSSGCWDVILSCKHAGDANSQWWERFDRNGGGGHVRHKFECMGLIPIEYMLRGPTLGQ